MLWITSDPVSYSQAIICFQLSWHLCCGSCLLRDNHLRDPFRQPEGSAASQPFSSQTWTLPILSTCTSEGAEVARSARPRAAASPTGSLLSLLTRFTDFKKYCKTCKLDFQQRFLGLVPRTRYIKKTEEGVYKNDNYFCSVMYI